MQKAEAKEKSQISATMRIELPRGEWLLKEHEHRFDVRVLENKRERRVQHVLSAHKTHHNNKTTNQSKHGDN